MADETGRAAEPGLRDAFTEAARKAGIARVAPGETPTGSALLAAIGGIRGIVESILPGLVFLVVYTVTQQLLPSVIVPAIVAVGFVVARLATKSPASSAIAGVVGVAISAAIALISGRAEDNFVWGFVINGFSLGVLLVSLIARYPLVGVIVGLLAPDGMAWRVDKAKRRVMVIATVMWAGLFALRLAVELPLYFAGETQWLGATKLLLGLPLYAGALWLTWLLVRAVYARGAAQAAGATSGS